MSAGKYMGLFNKGILIKNVYFFSWLGNIPLYLFTICFLSIHLWALRFVHILANANHFAMSIGVYVSF